MNFLCYPIVIGKVIDRVIQSAEDRKFQEQGLSPYTRHFESIEIPRITITEYLMHLNRYADFSESCFILSFIYIDKLLQKVPAFWINKKNIHRLFLISIVLAIKYSDDIYADNFVYAKIGGISLSELNLLEEELLMLLEFDLYVDPQLYFDYNKELLIHYERIINEEMKKHGKIMYSSTLDNSISTLKKSIEITNK